MKRTIALSESDLDLVKLDDTFTLNRLPFLPQSPDDSPQQPEHTLPWDWTPHRWALRFTLHLAFVSLFETIFFWKFISVQEDTALVNLVDTYTQGLWNTCANLTVVQRENLVQFINLFLNSSSIANNAMATYSIRYSFNMILLRNSWIYVGSITSLFLFIASAALWRKLPLRWKYIFFENITLVALLGAYEWMFFSTIVLKYQSISISELDQQIFNKFQQLC